MTDHKLKLHLRTNCGIYPKEKYKNGTESEHEHFSSKVQFILIALAITARVNTTRAIQIIPPFPRVLLIAFAILGTEQKPRKEERDTHIFP